MADGKKGFILYADQKELFEQLSDLKAGKLIKIIYSYVNDENPEITDPILKLAFTPIKTQLKRDLKHWEDIKQKRSEAGKMGGRPKKQTKAKKANALFEKQTKAKKAVIVNVNDNVNVNVKDIYRAFAHLTITNEEIDKLKQKGFAINAIDSILNDIENYKGNKKYNSLYLTALNWLKKEKAEKVIKDPFLNFK